MEENHIEYETNTASTIMITRMIVLSFHFLGLFLLMLCLFYQFISLIQMCFSFDNVSDSENEDEVDKMDENTNKINICYSV